MFSFLRLSNSDPRVGVEMQSTGEVACFGRDAHEAFLKGMIAGGFKLQKGACGVLLSLGSDEHKAAFLPHVQLLAEMGYSLFATVGTATFFNSRLSGSKVINITTVHQATTQQNPNVLSLLSDKAVKYVFNTPSSRDSEGTTAGYLMRRKAVDGGASLVFDFKVATMLVDALYHKWTVEQSGGEFWTIDSWHECHRIG